MKCGRCDGEAVYTRRYSGESLCGRCFSASIVRKTARNIAKYSMIRRGDDVAVAVSGGKDSLSLLHVLKQISGRGGFTLRAITIDEGIPGYREEALDIVREYCDSVGISYDILSYLDLYGATLQDTLESRSGSSCSVCGVLRRRAIEVAAGDADIIATAHNLDDTLQTFLINMLSGDTARIPWMHPKRGSKPRRVHPFGSIYESEIVFYAFVNDIPFQTEPCPHMNEGIRTPIREFLNELEKNHSGIKNNMYRSILSVADIMPNTKIRRTCNICGGQSTGDICSVCGTLGRDIPQSVK